MGRADIGQVQGKVLPDFWKAPVQARNAPSLVADAEPIVTPPAPPATSILANKYPSHDGFKPPS